jgi:Flp pilus assembly pilin Flp
MRTFLKSWLGSEQGGAVVEYAVIVFFIVLAVIGIIATLNDQSGNAFNAVASKIKDFGKIN